MNWGHAAHQFLWHLHGISRPGIGASSPSELLRPESNPQQPFSHVIAIITTIPASPKMDPPPKEIVTEAYDQIADWYLSWVQAQHTPRERYAAAVLARLSPQQSPRVL